MWVGYYLKGRSGIIAYSISKSNIHYISLSENVILKESITVFPSDS